MKKIGLILLMILSVLMSFGCAKKEAEIKSITVEFPYEDILCRSIKVDFEEEKATIKKEQRATMENSSISLSVDPVSETPRNIPQISIKNFRIVIVFSQNK